MKAPGFYFYIKDWASDPQLNMASHSTKGIWADMLCAMWLAPVRGELTGNVDQMQKTLRATTDDFSRFFAEAQELGFCDIVTHHNKKITVRNRRMYREQKYKDNNKIRQQRYRVSQKSNSEITPTIAIATAIANTKDKKNRVTPTAKAVISYSQDFERFWKEYPKRTAKKTAFKEWEKLNPNLDVVLSALDKQKRTKDAQKCAGQFAPEWPDPERWIKKERWNDEISDYIPTPVSTRQSSESPYAFCPKCKQERLKSNIFEDGCDKCTHVEKVDLTAIYKKLGGE